MKKIIMSVVAIAVVFSIGAGLRALSEYVPHCSTIADIDVCSDLCQDSGSYCKAYDLICKDGLGHYLSVCWNGDIYYTRCHMFCPGGSPIFRKLDPHMPKYL
jgi:hypothetical protein